MKKIILTTNVIKNELKKIYLHDVIKYVTLLFICLIYLVLYHFKPQLKIYNPNSVILLVSPLYIYIFLISAKNLYKVLKAYSLTKNDKFEIKTDVLINKSKKSNFSKVRGYHYTYKFIFELSGEYKIQKQLLNIYNPYIINNDELYNLSNIDDEFYIVSVGNWQNILVYNKKFFNL